jgi:HipA-like protein
MQYKHKMLDYKDVKAIKVYLELKSNREYVGMLSYNLGKYKFEYNKRYIALKKAIPIGPELPLTKLEFTSDRLFPSFEDRIPSQANPAYPEYCNVFNVDPAESNQLILLATLGSRGPSSLILEPEWGATFTADDLKKYRVRLGLSTRDFAECFGFSQASIVKIENRQSSGEEVLKLIEIFFKFPEVGLYLILRNASKLHSQKKTRVIELLSKEIAENNAI